MKRLPYLFTLIALLFLSSCTLFERNTAKSPSSSTTESVASSSSEETDEITRQFEYNLSLEELNQKQVYQISYRGDHYTKVQISLVQSIPDASDSQLTDPSYRSHILSLFEDSASMQKVRELDGLQVQASFNEANQLLIVIEADMTVLNLEEASQIPEFGSIFAGFKGTKPEEFITGLEVLGAIEIK